jgi:hypothetical protein
MQIDETDEQFENPKLPSHEINSQTPKQPRQRDETEKGRSADSDQRFTENVRPRFEGNCGQRPTFRKTTVGNPSQRRWDQHPWKWPIGTIEGDDHSENNPEQSLVQRKGQTDESDEQYENATGQKARDFRGRFECDYRSRPVSREAIFGKHLHRGTDAI